MVTIPSHALLAISSAIAVLSGAHVLNSDEIWGGKSLKAPAGLPVMIVVRQPTRNATIRDLNIDGAVRVIDSVKGATAANMMIDGLHAINLSRGLARFRGSSSGVIQNSSARFSATPQIAPNFPIGLHFEEQANNWTIRNVTVAGAQMVMDEKAYWNGDGIATERTTHDFRFVDVTSNDNTDAGFDLKGGNSYLDRVSASGNARNYRLWTSVRAGTLNTGDTVRRGGKGPTAGIWVKGSAANPPVIEIETLVVRMTKPGTIFFVQQGPAVIRVGRCDIQAPPGARLLTVVPDDQVKAEFGPGCKIG